MTTGSRRLSIALLYRHDASPRARSAGVVWRVGLIFLLLMAFGSGTTAAQSTGTITGTVRFVRTNAVIPNAVLHLYVSTGGSNVAFVTSRSTNASGLYSFSNLPLGTYYVLTNVTSLGYYDQIYQGITCLTTCPAITTGTPVNVNSATTYGNRDFYLSGKGKITGTLTDAAGRTVDFSASGSSVVQLYTPDGVMLTSAPANASGYYELVGLPPGTYVVRTWVQSYFGYADQFYQGVSCAWVCTIAGATPIVVGAGATVPNINFSLTWGGIVKGRVTDAGTTATISAASVDLFNSAGAFMASVSTNTIGVFTFGNLATGTYYVRTSASTLGYIDQLHQGVLCPVGCTVTTGTPIAVTAGLETPGINFALTKGATITGTVTDAGTHVGIPAAVAYLFDSAGQFVDDHSTNASGVFSFQGLPSGTYFVRTSAASLGYLGQLYQGILCEANCTVTSGTAIAVTAPATASNVNFALSKPATITGRVTDAATSLAIQNVTVHLYDSAGQIRYGVLSNASGVFSFGGVPAGTYYVRTYAAGNLGYTDQLYQGLPCGSPCNVTGGTAVTVAGGQTASNINFPLTKGATITGTLTDAVTGAPLASTSRTVYLYPASGQATTLTGTNASGVYSFTGLSAGTYRLRTVAGSLGYLDQLYQGLPCVGACAMALGTPVTVTASQIVTIDFSLAHSATIMGTITNASTGAAIPNQPVQIYDASGTLVTQVVSDASGIYIANTNLAPGTYYARTAAAASLGFLDQLHQGVSCASGCSVTLGKPIVISVSNQSVFIDFPLVPGGTITGTVTDGAAALSGVTVQIYNSLGARFRNVLTNASGVFTAVGLDAGTYYAQTSNTQGYIDQVFSGVSCASGCNATTGQAIALTVGQTRSNVNFVLATGGRISGTVTGFDGVTTGILLSGIGVSAFDPAGKLVTSTSTNSSGVYAIGGLAAGSYFVRTTIASAQGYLDQLYRALPCGGGLCTVTTGQAVAATPGSTTSGIDFALTKGGSISGTVRASNTSAPLSGVSVRVMSAAGATLGTASTNASGVYTVSGLPTGSHLVATGNPTGWVDLLYPAIPCPSGSCVLTSGQSVAVTAPATTSGIDFALAPGGLIQGTVTDAVSHAGIAGATVKIFDASGAQFSATGTDSTGAYMIRGLATGTYFATTMSPAPYGYAAQMYNRVACQTDDCPPTSGSAILVTTGATAAGIDFALDPAGGITGKLTQADGTTPLGGPASVTIHRQTKTGFQRISTVTADPTTGVYFVPNLPAGSYYVSTVNLLGYADQVSNGQPCTGGGLNCDKSVGTPVLVSAGQSTTGVNFALSAGSTLSGTVRSSGVPQANLTVTVLQSGAGAPVVVTSVVTGSDGTYRVRGLRSGAYFVYVAGDATTTAPMAYNGVPLPAGVTAGAVAAVATAISVTAPLGVSGIDFALTDGGTIAGKVLSNATGTAVTGCSIWAYKSDGTSAKGVVNQFSDGSYLLTGLPAGNYFLMAYPPRGAAYVTQLYSGLACVGCYPATGTPVAVTAGSTTAGIDFSLATSGQMSGLVTDAVTGAPLPNYYVRIWRAAANGQSQAVWSTTSNNVGIWTVEGLTAGTYFASTWGSLGHVDQVYKAIPCAGCDATKGTPITVTVGQTTAGIDFALDTLPPAANDQFASATVITGLPYQDVIDTRYATRGTTDPTPTCGSHSTERSVWYSYTATYTGALTLDTFGSTYDTILSVYSGSPGSFASVGCNEDADPTINQSRLTIPVVNGQTYSIMIGSYAAGGSGGFGGTLVLNAAVVPTMTVTPATLRFAGTNAGGVLSPMTAPQTVTVAFSSTAAVGWTATANKSWVQITDGSGIGSGTFTVGIINPGNVLNGVWSESAIVTVTAAGASNSPQTVAVELMLRPSVLNKAPIGLVDTPAQNATGIVGAIGVTGWVVDDVGIKSVTIYRNCLAFEPAIDCGIVNGLNLVYIGDATIVTGARPDIERAYPTYPQNNRAAWGYLLLTNMLPHVPNQLMFGGQGTLTLYALAEDLEGHKRWLGRDFITAPTETNETPTVFSMANDTIAKPFGAIDTPLQGQTVSGSFWNFGWTLTPDSNTTAGAGDILMPLNGSTQWVYIDGLPVAPIGAYNMCRGTPGWPTPYCDDDVSNIFGNPTPQATYTLRTANPTKHRNLDAGRGPIAAYWLDTTALANGIHTIAWGVTDSAGRGEGIGSRYFTVLNRSADAAEARPVGVDRPVGARHAVPAGPDSPVAAPLIAPDQRTQAAELALRDAPAQARGTASALETLAPAPDRVWGRTGFDLHAPYAEVAADDTGVRHVQIRDLGRLELWLGAIERGYLVANGTLRDLPPGSYLNTDTGVFTWAPGVGYLGTYRLVFVRGGEQLVVDVTIRPEEGR